MRLWMAAALGIVSAACAQTNVDEAVQGGVKAFKTARYGEAVLDFRRALAAGAGIETRLYLANAEAAQVVPSLNTPENLQLANDALRDFDAVLAVRPEDAAVLQQASQVYRYTNRTHEALALERRAAAADPGDATIFYTIGVLDWIEAYQNARSGLAHEGLQDNGAGNVRKSAALCRRLVEENQQVVEDAIASLIRAVELRTSYGDAMTYLSLVYRRRADLHCDDPDGVKEDLSHADEWAYKAMETRKRQEAAPAAGTGIGLPLTAPPPPPPPPPRPVAVPHA